MRAATGSRPRPAYREPADRRADAGSPATACRPSVGQVRYTSFVPDEVVELLVTEAALEKLGARAISADESGQLLRKRAPRAAAARWHRW
jgi:hypothetical protein